MKGQLLCLPFAQLVRVQSAGLRNLLGPAQEPEPAPPQWTVDGVRAQQVQVRSVQEAAQVLSAVPESPYQALLALFQARLGCKSFLLMDQPQQ